MFDKSQLMRGSLEGCVLKIICKKTTYGYEILEYLKVNGFLDLTEGTIYPILLRLEKQGHILSELKESPLGPKRKYYNISPLGRAYLNDFIMCFQEVHENVLHVLESEEKI